MQCVRGSRSDQAPRHTPVCPKPQLPGEGAPEHRHKAWTANVILKGPLRIGDKWYRAGDVAVIEPNIWYGPLEAGPDGAELLEIHATIPGVEAIWRDLHDPEVRSVNEWLEQTGKAAWKE